ncbi:MAG: selenocysteine-specific translation elongation factor [Archangiaceae bacterium]|nr:selenocysteine-specific translation elongation factor [Archangiaceae bacterium]
MIVGTAGHVDHGKTALVKALTGVDTDRLPEEKRRGITLELGFAHLDLPQGRVGVVDVPGHERFVKAMAAGAGGIDLAMLVVAADEGVMPQTREHVDICSLLGVRAGLLVVTKADLLPGLGDGWLELLTQDLRALTAGTFLEEAPLVTVSAKTGAGLDALKVALSSRLAALAARPAEGPVFLPVDRVFTVKGFGAVVTGTLLSGRLGRDEQVSLSPGLEGPFRARTLQVHGEAVERAAAGQRVAVNVPGIEAQQVSRGMALVRHGELEAAKVLDVELSLLPSVEAPLPRRSRQLLSLGTAHADVAVRLVDADALRPGERCFAQLRLAAPLAALPGQRFILRGSRALEGRGATLGGGRVLALDAPRRKKGASEKLKALAEADPAQRVTWLLTEAGYGGLTERELFARAGLGPKELGKLLEALGAKGGALLVDKEARRFVSPQVLAGLSARTLAMLEAFHLASPERDGMPKSELEQKLGVPDQRTFGKLLGSLVEQGRIEAGELVRLAGRKGRLDAGGNSLKAALDDALQKAGLQPATHAELAAQLKAPLPRVVELLEALARENRVHKAGELHFHASAVAELEAKLRAFFETHASISTAEFKELVGATRKFVIPLAELLDARKVTLRVGEKRVLRKR